MLSILTAEELGQQLVEVADETWTNASAAVLDAAIEPFNEEVRRAVETLRRAREQSGMVADSGVWNGPGESSIASARFRANRVRDVQPLDRLLADLDPDSDLAAENRALRAEAARVIARVDAEDGSLGHTVQGSGSEAEHARLSDRRSVSEQVHRQSSSGSREDRRLSELQAPRRGGQRSRGRRRGRSEPRDLSPPSEWTILIAEVPNSNTSQPRPRRRLTRSSVPTNVHNFTVNPSTESLIDLDRVEHLTPHHHRRRPSTRRGSRCGYRDPAEELRDEEEAEDQAEILGLNDPGIFQLSEAGVARLRAAGIRLDGGGEEEEEEEEEGVYGDEELFGRG
ncbi:hypothetical protein EJ03DRAFT_351774 [Teratosphaeria nubilosa]|uniref:Uncharacterized protein n=1 Tax=Teratosphaeria nubilosa TaxID=161662 RepID=A0A6G1L7W8_9PEZI|nr:hypothetical protein EJ03DRAFT_351774 [Teratosphaeria nubilosa]